MWAFNTAVNILGGIRETASAMTGLNSNYTYCMEKTGNRGESKELTVISNSLPVAGLCRANATVIAKEDVFITSLSTLFLNGICLGGDFLRDEIYLHLCKQTWQGEGQWQKIPVSDLCFFKKTMHHSTDSLHLLNTGSYTTAKLYPTFFIEDVTRGKTWAFQFEPVGNYHIEIGYDGIGGALFVNLEGVNDLYLQSGLSLKAGQEYTTDSAIYGVVDGGLNDALLALTLARREVFPNNRRKMPAVFNDYMNALWGNPNEDKLIPLIDRAAEVGAEVFCIDAGWFMPKSKNWDQALGDWSVSEDRFEKLSFRGLIEYINKKGMQTGCWLEMECASAGTQVFGKPDSWFLTKYGKRIGYGARYFLNYANADVRNYMRERVASLYGMGIRYIKNDYNECLGSGVDYGDGNTLGFCVKKAVNCFLSFVDGLREEFPDLVMENCASGAMRSDYATLSHFDLQSVTDQEDYVANHCITVGTLLNILPEHMGVWAYPIPQSFAHLNDASVLDTPEYIASMADGEQTAFNMVNGMLGNLYLSGRIDKADGLNIRLIKEGVDYYRANRGIIADSAPCILTGLPSLKGGNDFTAILYKGAEKGLLYVFRLGKNSALTLDISKYYQSPDARIGYGNFGGKSVECVGGKITVTLPVENSAAIIEVK